MTPSPSNREKQGSPDGLVVRGRPPFAMTPTSLLRNPSISSHAVRLWSVLASYTYGDQATDRPSQVAARVRRGMEVHPLRRHLPRRTATHRLPHGRTPVARRSGTVPKPLHPGMGTARTDTTRFRGTGRMMLFPQVTPRRRILHGGSSTQPRRLWTTLFPQVIPEGTGPVKGYGWSFFGFLRRCRVRRSQASGSRLGRSPTA